MIYWFLLILGCHMQITLGVLCIILPVRQILSNCWKYGYFLNPMSVPMLYVLITYSRQHDKLMGKYDRSNTLVSEKWSAYHTFADHSFVYHQASICKPHLTWSFLCPLICPHISLNFIPVTHLFSLFHSFDSPACIVYFAKLTAEKMAFVYIT